MNVLKRMGFALKRMALRRRRRGKWRIVRFSGGMGNQMFQYAFGLALQARTGERVLFDKAWFEKMSKACSGGGFSSDGCAVRKFDLGIFNSSYIPVASPAHLACGKRRVKEGNPFAFDSRMFTRPRRSYYSGFFQNEDYFKSIETVVRREFSFPPIPDGDRFNQEWLARIRQCENPVFVHLRRGDYLNLKEGMVLPVAYYKRAVAYIKSHVRNSTFFLFGQDCEKYIQEEFGLDVPFEIIGETNTKNHEDWKDLYLMTQCAHAIVANSTFSWWGAWLGGANRGIVVAPTPFMNGQDGIICKNWVKIERT